MKNTRKRKLNVPNATKTISSKLELSDESSNVAKPVVTEKKLRKSKKRKVRTPEENEELRHLLENEDELQKVLKKFLIYRIRRMTLHWIGRTLALDKARVERGLYRCYICNEAKFGRKDIEVDHIVPIVGMNGFTNWDDYIKKAFIPPSQFGIACKGCHSAKTEVESQVRKMNRKERKKK